MISSVVFYTSAIDAVTENATHPAAMSMSFRFLANQALDDAVARAVDAGIVAVVAAGNENLDAMLFSPSREPKVSDMTIFNTTLITGFTGLYECNASVTAYRVPLPYLVPSTNLPGAFGTLDEINRCLQEKRGKTQFVVLL